MHGYQTRPWQIGRAMGVDAACGRLLKNSPFTLRKPQSLSSLSKERTEEQVKSLKYSVRAVLRKAEGSKHMIQFFSNQLEFPTHAVRGSGRHGNGFFLPVQSQL
jgi:hypothetical protein